MINLDELHSTRPAITLTGANIFLVQQSGVTRAGMMSDLFDWIESGLSFEIGDITDATPVGIALVTAGDAVAARNAIGASDLQDTDIPALIDAHAPVAALIPEPPATGSYVLRSDDGVLTWEEVVE